MENNKSPPQQVINKEDRRISVKKIPRNKIIDTTNAENRPLSNSSENNRIAPTIRHSLVNTIPLNRVLVPNVVPMKSSQVNVTKIRRNSTVTNSQPKVSNVGKANSIHIRLRANSIGIRSLDNQSKRVSIGTSSKLNKGNRPIVTHVPRKSITLD
ncbi:hypothetical protein I4U23_005120 [Adineta vaga]|nr:hypothetical protein I4U23_005120 [Adineta vaga]